MKKICHRHQFQRSFAIYIYVGHINTESSHQVMQLAKKRWLLKITSAYYIAPLEASQMCSRLDNK